MATEFTKLDKTFNVTPEVVDKETKVIEKQHHLLIDLLRMKLLEIMSIQEVIFIV